VKCALHALVVGLVVLAVGAPPSAAAPDRAVVTSWIQLELEAISSHRTNPPRAARALALVSRAMYEAADADAAAQDAAVAGASSTVLAYLFPDEAARIDALAEPFRDSPASFALGERVGDGLVARGETDGSAATWTGTPPVGDAFWVPTPPAFVFPPLEPLVGSWKPWNLSSGSQFRPGPPPAYGSPGFLLELLQVYAVSKTLTPEQKRIADFWADGPGTVTPAGHWNAIAIELVSGTNWSVRRVARLFAALNTAQADAFIACWDAKYTYWSIRPVTAIRRLIEPTWLSYVVTPPFPSYVSGHSTTSGAASTVLSAFFPQEESELADLAEEAAVSRLYGGIHFRSDNVAGLALGGQVGSVAVAEYTTR
jgi:membrane-associated phospholipid phosphatase